MALLNLVPNKTKFDFIGCRKISFSIVVISTLVFALGILFKGLNYGIDFRGGIVLETRINDDQNQNSVKEKLLSLNLGDISIQEFGSNKDLLIKIEKPENKDFDNIVVEVKKSLGDGVEYRKVETIGAKVGAEMVSNGMKAVFYALIGILIYIAVRFEWRFAVCAVIALAHDCFLVLGLFSLFPLEFNETAITAILITASYSINDTIVVFDRIRENIKKYRKISLEEILNKSINETLSRTILTVATTFLSVLALYIFGGSVISSFVLPIMISLVIGTLSSIYVAAPLLLFFNIKYGKALDEEEEQIRRELGVENQPANIN